MIKFVYFHNINRFQIVFIKLNQLKHIMKYNLINIILENIIFKYIIGFFY